MKTEIRASVVAASGAAASSKLTTSTMTTAVVVSEWEDNVLFDADDPDFGADAPKNSTTAVGLHTLNAMISKVPSNVSIVDMQNSAFVDPSSLSLSSSLADWMDNSWERSSDNVLTIEQLREHIGSCFSCGVSWTDDHVSLDCTECGSYSFERPCPLCDGACGAVWKRDYSLSHACGKARWQGACLIQPPESAYPPNSNNNQIPVIGGGNAINGSTNSTVVSSLLSQATPQTCGASPFLANELCARLERLSASAQA